MDSSLVRFCPRMRSVAKLLRSLEVCILLAFLSWLSTRLPFAVRISGEYCLRFSSFILSPASIFLLGNAIVVTLLAKSGLIFSSEPYSPSIDNAVVEFYVDLRSEISDDAVTPATEEEIVFQDKEMIICGENAKTPANNVDNSDVKEEMVVYSELKQANYRRSKSENLRIAESEEGTKMNQRLRRSETDICRKEFAGGDEAFPEDGMSNEEFQRTIEAFIARQVRFHREERLAVVVHGQAFQ